MFPVYQAEEARVRQAMATSWMMRSEWYECQVIQASYQANYLHQVSVMKAPGGRGENQGAGWTESVVNKPASASSRPINVIYRKTSMTGNTYRSFSGPGQVSKNTAASFYKPIPMTRVNRKDGTCRRDPAGMFCIDGCRENLCLILLKRR